MKGLKSTLLRSIIPLTLIPLFIITAWSGYSGWMGGFYSSVGWVISASENNNRFLQQRKQDYAKNLKIYTARLGLAQKIELEPEETLLEQASDGGWRFLAGDTGAKRDGSRIGTLQLPAEQAEFFQLGNELALIVRNEKFALVAFQKENLAAFTHFNSGSESSIWLGGKFLTGSWKNRDNQLVQPQTTDSALKNIVNDFQTKEPRFGQATYHVPNYRGFKGRMIGESDFDVIYASGPLLDQNGKILGHFLFEVPEDILLFGVKQAIQGSALIMLFVGLLVVFIIVKIANRYINPLTSITAEIDGVTRKISGKIDHLEPSDEMAKFSATQIGGEIGVLNAAFEKLKYRMEQADENEILLRIAKEDMDVILNNINAGLFLIDREFRIGNQYSASLSALLEEQSLQQADFLSFLKKSIDPELFDTSQKYLLLLFREDLEEDMLVLLNPLDEVRMEFTNDSGKARSKYFEFSFCRVLQGGRIQNILVHLNDITQSILLARKLSETEKKNHTKMELLFNMLSIEPTLLSEFVEDTEAELENIESLLELRSAKDLQSKLEEVGRSLHSIKGNAALLEMSFFVDLVHEYEDRFIILKNRKVFGEEERLELIGVARRLHNLQDETHDLVERLSKFQRGLQKDDTKMQANLLINIEKMAQTQSLELKKEVRFQYDKFDSKLLPFKYRKVFRDILTQAVRNSIAHGIESSEKRRELSKQPYGTITLSFLPVNEEKYFEFIIRDDGRGLQLKDLRKRAHELKRWETNEIQGWSDRQLAQLIFLDGFSTSKRVGTLAGRGMGMDLIKQKTERQGGEVKIAFSENNFFELRILLPA